MRLLSLLVLLPVLAVGQVRSSDGVPPTGGTFSGPVTAESFTATAGAGSNGYHQSTGAYLDLGDGADDYLYSDGSLITASASLSVPSLTLTAASGAVGIQGVTGQKWCLDTGCTYYLNSSAPFLPSVNVTSIIGRAPAGLIIGTAATDGASTVAFKTVNYYALSTLGAKAQEWYQDNGSTLVASMYADGALWLQPHAIGTCGAATAPEGKIVTVAGATTHATKMCLCTYVPTGTTYAWKNISAIFADDATAFGDTTTCPDP
jgi:hypothetical protein